MIELPITYNQIQRAKELYPFEELKNSLTKGKRNLVGAIGEIVVNDYFNSKGYISEIVGDYNFDLIIDKYKIDVKTKSVNTEPRPYYLCNILASNTHQKCDFYFFCSLKKDFTILWLLGYYPQKKFIEDAWLNKVGDLDINGFQFKAENLNMKIENLIPFKNNNVLLQRIFNTHN